MEVVASIVIDAKKGKMRIMKVVLTLCVVNLCIKIYIGVKKRNLDNWILFTGLHSLHLLLNANVFQNCKKHLIQNCQKAIKVIQKKTKEDLEKISIKGFIETNYT